ncbi:hypothetical protein HRbin20_00725 [bacterium HR20]|nr:hypothetical protein HRbin20_00725 [bacterium HR20]
MDIPLVINRDTTGDVVPCSAGDDAILDRRTTPRCAKDTAPRCIVAALVRSEQRIEVVRTKIARGSGCVSSDENLSAAAIGYGIRSSFVHVIIVHRNAGEVVVGCRTPVAPPVSAERCYTDGKLRHEPVIEGGRVRSVVEDSIEARPTGDEIAGVDRVCPSNGNDGGCIEWISCDPEDAVVLDSAVVGRCSPSAAGGHQRNEAIEVHCAGRRTASVVIDDGVERACRCNRICSVGAIGIAADPHLTTCAARRETGHVGFLSVGGTGIVAVVRQPGNRVERRRWQAGNHPAVEAVIGCLEHAGCSQSWAGCVTTARKIGTVIGNCEEVIVVRSTDKACRLRCAPSIKSSYECIHIPGIAIGKESTPGCRTCLPDDPHLTGAVSGNSPGAVVI